MDLVFLDHTSWGHNFFDHDPGMINIRLERKGNDRSQKMENLIAPEESAISVAIISAITQIPCPTLGQFWKQVLHDPDCRSYATLREKLNRLENNIDQRNMVRDANADYHPRYCAMSISS